MLQVSCRAFRNLLVTENVFPKLSEGKRPPDITTCQCIIVSSSRHLLHLGNEFVLEIRIQSEERKGRCQSVGCGL